MSRRNPWSLVGDDLHFRGEVMFVRAGRWRPSDFADAKVMIEDIGTTKSRDYERGCEDTERDSEPTVYICDECGELSPSAAKA